MIKDQLDKNKKQFLYFVVVWLENQIFLIQRYLYSLYNYEHEK